MHCNDEAAKHGDDWWCVKHFDAGNRKRSRRNGAAAGSTPLDVTSAGGGIAGETKRKRGQHASDREGSSTHGKAIAPHKEPATKTCSKSQHCNKAPSHIGRCQGPRSAKRIKKSPADGTAAAAAAAVNDGVGSADDDGGARKTSNTSAVGKAATLSKGIVAAKCVNGSSNGSSRSSGVGIGVGVGSSSNVRMRTEDSNNGNADDADEPSIRHKVNDSDSNEHENGDSNENASPTMPPAVSDAHNDDADALGETAEVDDGAKGVADAGTVPLAAVSSKEAAKQGAVDASA